MSQARRTTALSIAFVVAVVVMVAIPTIRLFDSTQGRFGWHMFSRGSPAVEMTVRFGDSTSARVVLEDHLVVVRGDVPISAHVPAALCDAYGGSVEILVTEGPDEWIVSCR